MAYILAKPPLNQSSPPLAGEEVRGLLPPTWQGRLAGPSYTCLT
jgi:hypothetical protein